MAKYVVLSFEDNANADAFLAHPDSVDLNHTAEVVGIFQKPTMFCPNSHSGGCRTGKRFTGFVRGKKYGWWVCAGCHKPIEHPQNKLLSGVIAQGRNLLTDPYNEDPEAAADQQPPENVHSVWDRGWGVLGRSRL